MRDDGRDRAPDHGGLPGTSAGAGSGVRGGTAHEDASGASVGGGGRHARTDDLPGPDAQGAAGRRTAGDTVDHSGRPDDDPGIVDKMLGRADTDEPRR